MHTESSGPQVAPRWELAGLHHLPGTRRINRELWGSLPTAVRRFRHGCFGLGYETDDAYPEYAHSPGILTVDPPKLTRAGDRPVPLATIFEEIPWGVAIPGRLSTSSFT